MVADWGICFSFLSPVITGPNANTDLTGYVKIRNQKGARYGWGKKMYACVKNFRLLIFEKAFDQENPEKAIHNFNLRYGEKKRENPICIEVWLIRILCC